MDKRLSTSLGFFVALSCLHTVHGGAGNPWTYNGTLGPKHWHVDYPKCGGGRQSPINIVTGNVVYNDNLKSFNLDDLKLTEGVNMSLQNVNGHTVEVIFTGSTNMLVKGGNLDAPYQVKQFHFHWGKRDERGSEHDIDSKQFPMEMHIVLYSTKFDNFSEAVDKPKGLAVLAFLFQVGEKNTKFEPLLTHFGEIQHSGNETTIPVFSLKSLLPENTETYFRYEGSLTTPPCFESVVWTVFASHITVSEEQLELFRHIKRNRAGGNDVNLVDDFRPLQELNDRRVYTNDINLSSGQDKSSLHTAILFLSLLLYIVTI